MAIWITLAGGTACIWCQRSMRRWSPVPRVGLSLVGAVFGIYLLSGVLYLTHAPRWLVPASVVAAAGLLAVYGPRMWRRAHRDVRWVLLLTAAFGLWLGLLAAFLPMPIGGNWQFDWLEHYLRARFFLHHDPVHSEDLGFAVTGRPPLVNLLVSYYMALGTTDYLTYQSVNMTLNSLVATPIFILAALRRRRVERWLLVLVAFSTPFILWNSLYPWTRGVSNALILAGIFMYIRHMYRPRFRYAFTAFVLLAVASLAHYSSGPYIVVALGHWLLGIRQAPGRWLRQTAIIGAVCAVILATWFVPAIATYGLHDTLSSNTSVTEVADLEEDEAINAKFTNQYATWIPHPLRTLPPDYHEPPDDLLLRLGLHGFQLTETNGTGMMGPLLVVAMLLAWGLGLRQPDGRRQLIALAVMATVVAVLGVAALGYLHPTGVAHVCLQPLLAACMCGTVWRWAHHTAMRRLLILNQALLFAFGVALHLVAVNYIHDLLRFGTASDDLIAQSMTLQTAKHTRFLMGLERVEMIADRPAAYLLAAAVGVGLLAVWYRLAPRRPRGES